MVFSMTMAHTVGIPIVLVAITTSVVAPHVLKLMLSFRDELDMKEQVAFLVMAFALIFAAVGTSHVPIPGISPGGSLSSGNQDGVVAAGSAMRQAMINSAMKKHYPLDDLAKAQNDKDKFMLVYPMLRDEILQSMKGNEMPPEALEWAKDMMDYNVPGGKLNRGVTVLTVYRSLIQAQHQPLKSSKPLTPLESARASVLGWTIEFLQAFFLVADDVMDDSQTRRGQPCWYKQEKVKMIAINDSFLLESYVFTILRNHFGHEPFYFDLVELMLDVIQKTEFGQLLDLTSQPQNASTIDLERFTFDRYQRIVKYKTAFYTFYLPIAMGMLLAGTRSPDAFNTAKRICCIMGEYFQIQDDVLDCFGDPKVIGKVGTDIQDNKCSWLVCQALKKCTPAQRKILEDNYGKWDDEKVAIVKQLYKDLELQQLFEKYEEDSYKEIQAELDKLTTIPRDVFEVLLKKIYKRSM